MMFEQNPKIRRFLKTRTTHFVGPPCIGETGHSWWDAHPENPGLKFSLIITTRDRVELLERCIEDFLDKADDPDSVEIICVFDHNDPSYRDFEPSVVEKQWVNLVTLKVARSPFYQRDYNNRAAAIARGTLVFVLNDECLVEEGWDTKIWDVYMANKPDDDILMITTNDDTHDSKSRNSDGEVRHQDTFGCCFPILTKTYCLLTGGIFPNEINMWGADTQVYNIMSAIDRVVNADVMVQHESFHSNERKRDEQGTYVAEISTKKKLTQGEFDRYVTLLREYINETKTAI